MADLFESVGLRRYVYACVVHAVKRKEKEMVRSIRSLCLVSVATIIGLVAVQRSSSSPKPSQAGDHQRLFTGSSLQEIAFPIGGIGTGSISLGGRGDLRDWEIFNRPDKGSRMDFSFFALWAKAHGKKPVARILERKAMPPYRGGGFGMSQQQLFGLPRLDEAEFKGEYPFATIRFRDRSLPVNVELTAWNPFIPLDVDNSALPVAFFVWTFDNPSGDTVDISLSSSLFNPIGSRYTDVKNQSPGLGKNLNRFVEEKNFRGLLLSSEKVGKDDPNYGTMALATTWGDLDVQTRWYRGGWWDACHTFWDDFSDDGRVTDLRDSLASDDHTSDVGCLVLHAKVPPHGKVSLPVLIAWHFPNRENYWNGESEVRGKMMKNYVAKKFSDAWEVVRHCVDNWKQLEEDTYAFHQALFSSTLPPYVIDAVSSQMSILKTNVCMLLDDGSFYGFEGNGDNGGCCPLNCMHVWNYEQSLAFLFPQLERSMRETDFLHNTLPNGYMTFRTLVPLGNYWWKFKACADGQMGSIIRAYREWKLSGDTEWLRKLWPNIQNALEFAWRGTGSPPPQGFEWTKEQVSMPWDPDTNGVMEGEQHNTYDIEFYGPNTMTGSLYLGALKAASEMAAAVGESGKAETYRSLFTRGSALYEKELWNGDYYTQDVYVLKGLQVPKQLISPEKECCAGGGSCRISPEAGATSLDTVGGIVPKYQYGQGCLSDQLLGQYLAHVAGLGYVLDPQHVRTAANSIFKYNFRKSMAGFPNVQRVFALNDDAGLLLCSWPKGNRPALPFVYSDEVWTGIEYQVAATLIYNGWLKEGLSVVKAVRDRYDGVRRNPWDEEECGHHYARAMASWAVLLALSGFHFDGVAQCMSFDPAIPENEFKTFWSCGPGWGTFVELKQGGREKATIEVHYGSLKLKSLSLGHEPNKSKRLKVTLNGNPVPAKFAEAKEGTAIQFEQPVEIPRDGILEVSLSQ